MASWLSTTCSPIYAFDTFAHADQARDLALRSVTQYQQREAMRWGLLWAGSDRVIGTRGYTRWNREHHLAILGYDGWPSVCGTKAVSTTSICTD